MMMDESSAKSFLRKATEGLGGFVQNVSSRLFDPQIDPGASDQAEPEIPVESPSDSNPPTVPKPTVVREIPVPMIVEVGTFLWSLKTRHFKCAWGDVEFRDQEPLPRRTLRQLMMVVDKLGSYGITIEDPTGRRYASGSEASIWPLQFIPTDDITREVVAETMRPMILLNDRVIQRAEVMVAVPKTQAVEPEIKTNETGEAPNVPDNH